MLKSILTLGSSYVVICAVSAGGAAGDNCRDGGSSDNAVLVEIDGVMLTRADFEQKLPTSFFQVRNTLYDAERKAVSEFVDEYLLERQARKKNLSVGELLERHVNAVVPKDPSDEALQVYYEGLNATEPFEAVRSKIIEYLRQRRIAKAKAAYLESLRSDAKVLIRLAPPRARIPLNGTPIRGPADAPVVLVEYADYECPYCQTLKPQLEKLQAEYKGKLAVVYKDMPLPTHPSAQKAAEGAHCAGAQGKYWEYHDLLFSSKEYGVAKLKENARALKLDGEVFDKCLDSGERAEAVKASLAEGQALGLPGTPAVFINGRLLSGTVDYEAMRNIIEDELRQSAAR
jgi:protein-disulfide isomerase